VIVTFERLVLVNVQMFPGTFCVVKLDTSVPSLETVRLTVPPPLTVPV
jgi:hypothetical protein